MGEDGSPAQAMSFTIDDPLLLSRVQAVDLDCLLVQSVADVEGMCAEILGAREHAVIGIAPGLDGRGPTLAPADVRRVVGPGVRIYLLAREDSLKHLRRRLGVGLALGYGAARVWWPGAGRRCDPCDHPLVMALADEPVRVTLAELSSQFELSRPVVRAHVKLIEDTRALLERELRCAEERNRRIHERLRDAQIERHRMRTRAEAAEARLAASSRAAKAPGR